MDSYSKYVLERLSLIGPISTRVMFGGVGFYHQGIMFALIADGTLYMKVDSQNKSAYEDADMQPFTYQGKNKVVQMSYWELPSDVLESEDQIVPWLIASFQAAKRAKVKSPKLKTAAIKNKKKGVIKNSRSAH